MADPAPGVTEPAELCFEASRLAAFVATLEAMAGGTVDARLPVSARHDALDAIAHGINVLVGELSWISARTREAAEQKASELQSAVSNAEARSEALLRAVPDLMFVIRRDGTFVDYQARDPKLLWVPPSEFLGRTVRDVMPSDLADVMMTALDRACGISDPIVIEYELRLSEQRFFEARIVRAGTGTDLLLTIVRDVTEAKRGSELVRDLAGRLIARQEVERQRVARDLHDDISQRIGLLNIEIDRIASQIGSEQLRERLRTLSAHAGEIAGDVHRMSYALHPSRLQTLGLVTAIESLCVEMSQQRHLDVRFTHGPIPAALDGSVSLCLYRIVQEALHNVARHSGTREARVSLVSDAASIALEVADSGVGFNPGGHPYGSLGLAGMQERVTYLKGRLVIDAFPGGGTRISVRIPLEAAAIVSTRTSTQSSEAASSA